MSNNYRNERNTGDGYNDSDLYRFTIQNGKVVGVEEFDDGRWEFERIDADESYTVEGRDIIKTEWEHGGTEITRYSDDNGDGLYVETSEVRTSSAPTAPIGTATAPAGGTTSLGTLYGSRDVYAFTFTDGQITGVTEYEHGMARAERIDANTTYVRQGSEVIKTEIERGGQEITRYSDVDGDGLYLEVSEQWVPTGGNAGLVGPVSSQVLRSQGDDGDDLVAVRAAKSPAQGGRGADTFFVRDWGHVVIQDFNRSEGDHIVFDMGQGVDSLQKLGQRLSDLRWDGDDLYLGLGQDASVTLVGARIHGIGLDNLEFLS